MKSSKDKVGKLTTTQVRKMNYCFMRGASLPQRLKMRKWSWERIHKYYKK